MSCLRLVRRQIKGFMRLDLCPIIMHPATESLLLPCMLFDPVNQFKQICKAAGIDILCPLSSRDGISESVIDMGVSKQHNCVMRDEKQRHGTKILYYR